ncbi:MAG: hypothetical protein LBT44_09600 [Clostridiales bacterium]|nr:hypothetical protein [Clostridiales bacterium]
MSLADLSLSDLKPSDLKPSDKSHSDWRGEAPAYQPLGIILNADPLFRLSLQEETESGQTLCVLRLRRARLPEGETAAFIKWDAREDHALYFKYKKISKDGDQGFFFLVPNGFTHFPTYCAAHVKEIKKHKLSLTYQMGGILTARSGVFLTPPLLFIRPADHRLAYMPFPSSLVFPGGISGEISAELCPLGNHQLGLTPAQRGVFTIAAFLLYFCQGEGPNVFHKDRIPLKLQPVLANALHPAVNLRPRSVEELIRLIQEAAENRGSMRSAFGPLLCPLRDRIRRWFEQYSEEMDNTDHNTDSI